MQEGKSPRNGGRKEKRKSDSSLFVLCPISWGPTSNIWVGVDSPHWTLGFRLTSLDSTGRLPAGVIRQTTESPTKFVFQVNNKYFLKYRYLPCNIWDTLTLNFYCCLFGIQI